MKLNALFTAAALATLAWTAPSVAAPVEKQSSDNLYFYNWSDYIGENTLKEFTEKTGINVVYDVYDSNEVLEGRLLSGRSGFDLVSPSHDFYKTQIKAGVYAKLDKSKLPNLKNLDPQIMKLISDNFDEDNAHGIPYLWVTTGIGYNKDKVEEVLGKDAPVDSWALVFEPENMKKLQSCGVAFLDAPSEILPSALTYLGIPGNSLEIADYRKAVDKVKEVAPYVTYFHSTRSLADLANGDICVAIGWSGDMMMARDRAVEANNGQVIRYSIPKEGAAMSFDMLAIPNDAPHKDAAHQMLNFLMEPEVIAGVTDYVSYANPNPASKPYVDEEIANDPGIYPSEKVMEKLFVFREYPRQLRRYVTREWNSIKAGS